MKKILFLLVFIPSIIVAEDEIYSRFYPEGTTWTELVLDTLAHDSWFSKDGDNWVANYETVTYYVKGQVVIDGYGRTVNCVYTRIAGEPDSWAFIIEDPASQYMDFKWVKAGIIYIDAYYGYTYSYLGLLYHFDWVEGEDFRGSIPLINTLSFGSKETINYGIIEKIEEGDFGGVRPLNYVDLTATIWYSGDRPIRYYPVRMIQGIGVTTWDGPQCILGPVEIMTTLPKSYLSGNPFMTWFKSKYGTEESHHRSMLVHFERNGEVLYDVWPSPEGMTNEVKYVLAPKPENDTPALYDLSGRKLEQKPSKGIYIQDGRVLVK